MSALLSPMTNLNRKCDMWVDLFWLHSPSGNTWVWQFIGFASLCLCLSVWNSSCHWDSRSFLWKKPSVTTEISCLKLLLWGCHTFSLPSIYLFQVLFACKFLLLKHNRRNFIKTSVLSDLISTSVISTVSLSNSWSNLCC